MTEINCPPYDSHVGTLGADASILDHAANAQRAVNAYRQAMDDRADFRTTVRAAAVLARATDALTSAIADAVACGDSSLT